MRKKRRPRDPMYDDEDYEEPIAAAPRLCAQKCPGAVLLLTRPQDMAAGSRRHHLARLRCGSNTCRAGLQRVMPQWV